MCLVETCLLLRLFNMRLSLTILIWSGGTYGSCGRLMSQIGFH